MAVEEVFARRVKVHAALGDRSRLAIADRLMLGDVAPGELADMFGMPSNLLAHHLRVLGGAGLIERVRSEGDLRRSYVRLVPKAFAGLTPDFSRPAARVVFVCTHNSARSSQPLRGQRRAGCLSHRPGPILLIGSIRQR